jgi:hypothetical protein
MKSIHAVGSLMLILSNNLLYYSADLKQPFLPKICINLNKDINKLIEYVS